ncbi:SIR2 family protein [Amnibacterium endophyticum]|uniref:SIR2 family protein n=1 Tax=Amnibacterium endophyticum TaxID=2109337 RepID=A0ABW4LHX5_9MICO
MLSPSSSFDPQISLATSTHAQPGVFALLLGSGVSTGSGVPTGWGVIRTLVIRASAANGNPLAVDASDDEIEQWWTDHGDGQPLGYSGLLEALAPTSAARRALLAGFFEASDEEREENIKVPSRAHEAIADLVARGYVRVILTTNFDRLTERALESRGVSPQVISDPAQIAGMEPLVHSRCTVIKLHGDYASLEQRNTVDELSTYPTAQNDLLARILDEYGLIVSGWSADWDRALVAAIEGVPSRRYPWYWGQMGPLGHAAETLTARRGADVISGVTAEDLFGGLVSRLDAIESLSLAPTSTNIAVAQVKRMLPNPVRRLELRDLFDRELKRLGAVMRERPSLAPSHEPAGLQAAHDDLRAAVDTLLHMYFTGVLLDRDRDHTDLWVWVLQRVLRMRRQEHGSYHEWFSNLQHYPALLLFWAGSFGAVLAGHEDVFLALAKEPRWKNPYRVRGDGLVPAFAALEPFAVLDEEVVKAFQKANRERWTWPISHMLIEELRPVVADEVGDGSAYVALAHEIEYRLALADLYLEGGYGYTYIGNYAGETELGFQGELQTEQRFRQNADVSAWGWASEDALNLALGGLLDHVRRNRRW